MAKTVLATKYMAKSDRIDGQWIETGGNVTLYVNVPKLINMLGWRALNSRTKRAILAGGAIEVKLTNETVKALVSK